ncbi:uncharacterized protein M6B38_187710 [Iris pallida]|uniref:Uncharacterized protein n=1 Tax=Iris pallida TaxID=29817 RepID=A0AAX6EI48_IRIPA|nr:uncharacterized protein M6B38_187710 [Iris pallida]
MRDFPSCFGESGVQVSDSSSGSSRSCQNMVTCLYKAHLRRRPCVITVTWTRHLMGQGLAVGIDDSCSKSLCKVDIKPWLFTKTKGSKSLDADDGKVDIFWDLSAARFGSGPEPSEGFYVAVLFDLDMVLLLGDLTKEAHRKTNAGPSPSNAVLVAKKEHLFGKNVYSTKAQLCDSGKVHDVAIECETAAAAGGGGGGLKEPSMEIRIDRRRVVQVKRLGWKFRGNQTILVDGTSVEVFWDVHSWLFGGHVGNAVFMFQSCLPTEKLLPWSCSQSFKETQLRGLGFSLVLYAWKSE